MTKSRFATASVWGRGEMREIASAPIAVWLCILMQAAVSFAQEQAPKRVIEIRPGAATHALYRRAHLDFCQREIELYQSHTADPADVRPAAQEFLRRAIRRFSEQTESQDPLAGEWNTLSEIGAKAVEEAGSQDPLLLAHYVDALLDGGQKDKAIQLADDCLTRFDQSDYPRGMRLLILTRVQRVARLVGDTDKMAKIQAMIYQAAPEWLTYAAGQPNAQRFAWNYYARAADQFSTADAKAAVDAYGERDSKDAWLWEMLQGKYYYDLAWHVRGDAPPHTIKRDVWQQYLEHMKLAAAHYRAAFELNPTLPESAAAMIAVAKEGHDLDSTWDWFNRAIAAEADHLPAYKEILQSLLPKWGGSLGELFDFGEACVRTDRFDTDIPYVFILAVYAVHAETQSWPKVFEEPRLYDKATFVLAGLLDHPSRAGTGELSSAQAELLTQELGFAVQGGQLKEAKRIRERLGDHASKEWLDFFGLSETDHPAP